MLKLKTFFRAVEKLNKIEMKKWISNFMIHLRKFYINDELAFVYNDLSKEFGVATADIKVLNRGNDREYFSSYFEKFLTKYWEHLKRPTTFDIKSATHRINVLLEFHEVISDDTVNNEYRLKFKKLSDRSKTPVCATEGSVRYDLYSGM